MLTNLFLVLLWWIRSETRAIVFRRKSADPKTIMAMPNPFMISLKFKPRMYMCTKSPLTSVPASLLSTGSRDPATRRQTAGIYKKEHQLNNQSLKRSNLSPYMHWLVKIQNTKRNSVTFWVISSLALILPYKSYKQFKIVNPVIMKGCVFFYLITQRKNEKCLN